jgi:sugar/nucleoside kinase (ribokinase family)
VVKARLHADFELLVIGELNADLLNGEDITPAFGQAEKLVDDAILTVGSPSAIFAHQAARLGLRVAFAGKVGADTFGEFMARRLREAGIDTSGVMVDPSLKTGLTVHLVRGAVRAMLTHPGAMTALGTEEIDERLLRSSHHVHLGSYFLQESIQPGLPRLFARAREAEATTSLDPNWDPAERWDSSIREVLRETDVFLPNEQELLAIAGKAATEAALEEFADIPTIVVKRGSAGAVGYEGGEGVGCVPPPTELVDTTGAGDGFDAGFVFGLLRGYGLERALNVGCVYGALSTRGRGGVEAQPDLEHLASFDNEGGIG